MRRVSHILLTIIALLPTSAMAAQGPIVNSQMLPGKVGVVKISTLNAAVTRQVRSTVDALAKRKPIGIIVDLRGNMGGDIAAVQAIVECFLQERTPYMQAINVYRIQQVTAQPPVVREKMPVVVLMDERTNNEAMIVAYVLQKIRRAGVVAEGMSLTASIMEFPMSTRIRNYAPLKEFAFTVIPDVRVQRDWTRLPAGNRDDGLLRAMSFVRDVSPWAAVKK